MLRHGQRRHIAILLGIAAACILVGGGAFAATQGKPFTTGLYWAVATATTVGYGDVTPDNWAGRLVASLVMLTTIPLLASVFAIATGGAAVAGVRRLLAMHSHFPTTNYLVAAGVCVVLLADVDQGSLPSEVHVVRGDPTDEAAIKTAKAAGAEQALITGKTDGEVLVSAVLTRKQAPNLPIVALVNSPSVREALQDLGVQQVMSSHKLIASTLAKSLEAPHAADMLSELVEADTHRIGEFDVDPLLVGKRLSAVREERAGLVLGLVQQGKFTLGVDADPVVLAGDRLLVAEPCHEVAASD
jgi:voltage-gated potassium channel